MKKCDSIHKNNLQILYSNHFNKLDSKIYKYSTHLYFDRNTLIDFKDSVNENNLAIVTKFIFKTKDSLLKYFRRNNINTNNINPNNIKIVQNINNKNRFLIYLFKEFNLFE